MPVIRTPEESFHDLPGFPFQPHYVEVTTPRGYKPGASGKTRPCRPTATKASSKIFLLPL
jgi:hypothetical protein